MIAVSLINLDKKEQHGHTRRLLRECLKPFGADYVESAALAKGEYGKPYLAEHPEIHFNLSHGDGIAACIVGGRECGIDCERIRPFRSGVIKRVFSEREKEVFWAIPDEQKDTAFFRLWTLKEAYIKAIGMGLSFPMNEAEFILSGDGFTTNIKGYRFRQYIIREKFVVSVCTAIDEQRSAVANILKKY